MTPPPSPESLFSRHVAGDSTALDELARRLSPRLQRLAQRLGADREESLDAVQDTWLAVLRSGERFDTRRPLLPWLFSILRFRWRSTRRRGLVQPTVVDSEALENASGASSSYGARSAETLEAIELVRAALAELPERYRAPLWLHLVHGLSPVEIADRLALPRSSVRVLLHRGRAMLQRMLPRGAFALILALITRRSARATSRVSKFAASAAMLAFFAALAALWTLVSASRAMIASTSTTEPAAFAITSTSLNEHTSAASFPSDRVELEDPNELELTVLDSRGHGLANVGLEVIPRNGSDPRLRRQLAVTDQHGRARVRREPGVPLRVFTDRRASVDVGPEERRISLVAPSGVDVAGRVLDHEGRGLAKAAIWFGDLEGSRRGQVVAHSRDDGSFELHDVPRDASIAAFAPGHQRTSMHALPRANAAGQVSLDLIAKFGGASVSARVVDASGTPVQNARVIVGRSVDGIPPELAQGLLPAFPPPLEGWSDLDGTAELCGLEPGSHDIVVRASGCAPWSSNVFARDGEGLQIEARLERGVVVSGRVLDQNGQPLAAAQVAWTDGDPLAVTYVETGFDGEFVFDAIPAGTAWIAARAFDHGVAERELSMQSGERRELELTLASLPVCAGTLVDDTREPLADFGIRLLGHVANSISPDADESITDELGRFSLVVPGGDLRRIEVRGPGWPEWSVVQRDWLRVDGQSVHIEFPRSNMPNSWLLGSLSDARGRPVSLRTLDLVRRTDMKSASLIRAVARTADDGSVRIGPLEAGQYKVVLAADPIHEPDAMFGLIGTYALGEAQELDITCQLPEASEVLCTLRLEDGATPSAPIVAITLRGAEFELDTWRASERTLNLLPGRYELKAMGEDFPWIDASPLTVEPGVRARWAPRLEPACATRIALAELPVDVDRAAGLVIFRELDGHAVGRFQLTRGAMKPQVLKCFLATGAYRASVRRADGSVASENFDVDALGANDLNLRWIR